MKILYLIFNEGYNAHEGEALIRQDFCDEAIRLGYWLNLGVVGAADNGLFIFLIIPDYMAPADGFPGPLLWVLALVFSTIGLLQNQAEAVLPRKRKISG